MKLTVAALVALLMLSSSLGPRAQTPQTPAPPQGQAAAGRGGNNNDAFYQLGPDSLPREGVPHGTVDGPYMLPTTANIRFA